MKWITEVKYSRIAVPEELAFETEAEAREYATQKEQNNPYVRWTAVRFGKKKYPHQESAR